MPTKTFGAPPAPTPDTNKKEIPEVTSKDEMVSQIDANVKASNPTPKEVPPSLTPDTLIRSILSIVEQIETLPKSDHLIQTIGKLRGAIVKLNNLKQS